MPPLSNKLTEIFKLSVYFHAARKRPRGKLVGYGISTKAISSAFTEWRPGIVRITDEEVLPRREKHDERKGKQFPRDATMHQGRCVTACSS